MHQNGANQEEVVYSAGVLKMLLLMCLLLQTLVQDSSHRISP